MENKQINLLVNQQDIRGIIATLSSAILIRQAKIRDEIIKNLNTDPENQTSKQILEIFRKLLKNNNRANQELENLSPLILSLSHVPEDFESPSEAEVLEDLSDLEEDSLGVDSGGEEAVGLSSDHPEE